MSEASRRAAEEENDRLRNRLAEREEFIRQNAGPLLAERDAKIERQRAQLQRLSELYAGLKLAHSGCRDDLDTAIAQAVKGERERCMKVICPWCRDGAPLLASAECDHLHHPTGPCHRFRPEGTAHVACKAAALRAPSAPEVTG